MKLLQRFSIASLMDFVLSSASFSFAAVARTLRRSISKGRIILTLCIEGWSGSGIVILYSVEKACIFLQQVFHLVSIMLSLMHFLLNLQSF